ncbi:hypothetical protein [Granulicella tundricola]|uniref:hypothetical protein n=1 Tax=Granulicella tundricola TaxID=940615 RepID=UPI0001DB75B8|nr:hypothetical protein [Granulicella tundricola]
MTNLQLLLAIGIPSLLVMFGILLNRQEAASLRAEIGQLRGEMKSEIGQLLAEMKSENNQLRNEIITLRDNIHEDMMGVHERLRAVETRQGI